jgi:cell division protein FtsZ
MEAMNYLSEQTSHQAEIIPGLITDERMRERVQVILIITGLGGSPVDTRRVDVTAQLQEVPAQPIIQKSSQGTPSHQTYPLPQPVNQPSSQTELQSSLGLDLDVPAFLRRRPTR